VDLWKRMDIFTWAVMELSSIFSPAVRWACLSTTRLLRTSLTPSTSFAYSVVSCF